MQGLDEVASMRGGTIGRGGRRALRWPEMYLQNVLAWLPCADVSTSLWNVQIHGHGLTAYFMTESTRREYYRLKVRNEGKYSSAVHMFDRHLRTLTRRRIVACNDAIRCCTTVWTACDSCSRQSTLSILSHCIPLPCHFIPSACCL